MSIVQDWLAAGYDWLKALHVISMVAWMAGLFYLPRIYVYHAERAAVGSELSETFKIMELKLFRLIMNPSMIATWIFGLLMVFANGWDWFVVSYWFHVKVVLILLLTWFHHWCGKRRKDFLADRNEKSGRHYRLMNEVPTLALLVIVIMVIVQPI
ncbi:MAG: protoporphyrinogen oxidase HemJ [Pseudomonadota bacterium]